LTEYWQQRIFDAHDDANDNAFLLDASQATVAGQTSHAPQRPFLN